MAGIIEFIIKASNFEQNELGKQFQDQLKSDVSSKALLDWFKKNGYENVTETECVDLIKNKSTLMNVKVVRNGGY